MAGCGYGRRTDAAHGKQDRLSPWHPATSACGPPGFGRYPDAVLRSAGEERWTWRGVAVSVLALVVVAGGACLAVPVVRSDLFPGGSCSDAERRFSQLLAVDAVVVQAPVGATVAYRRVFEACEGNGDSSYYGGVSVGWSYPSPRPSATQVRDFYADLAAANGWDTEVVSPADLDETKMVDGTHVSFLLRQWADSVDDNEVYWVELANFDLVEDLSGAPDPSSGLERSGTNDRSSMVEFRG